MRVNLRAMWPMSFLLLAAGAPSTPLDMTQFDLLGVMRKPAASGGDDPIRPIAIQMQGLTAQLQAMQTDAPVQAGQEVVVANLDTVIAQLEQQCKSGSGTSANPTKPLNRSIITGGPGGSGPLHDAQAGTRAWGQLPPKDREQITQSQTEGFPPGYESVLASYYSRLSQEQVTADAEGAGPATQPAQP